MKKIFALILWLFFCNSRFFAQAKDSLPTINLCNDYEHIPDFYFPINSYNFQCSINCVHLDSASLKTISSARVVSIDDLSHCSDVSGEDDSSDFKEDFNGSQAYYVSKFHTFFSAVNHNYIELFAIRCNASNRLYLITFRMLNQKKDFLVATDVILIENFPGGNGHWSHRRNAILYDKN